MTYYNILHNSTAPRLPAIDARDIDVVHGDGDLDPSGDGGDTALPLPRDRRPEDNNDDNEITYYCEHGSNAFNEKHQSLE